MKHSQSHDFVIDVPRPIKLFNFEANSPQIRNEFCMGLNLMKHRFIKYVHKMEDDSFRLYTACLSKRNKTDYSQVHIEYLDEKLNENPQFPTTLILENFQDRSFILTQDPGVIEINRDTFDIIFKSVDRKALSYEKLSRRRKHGIWPVVIMNNCAVNFSTKELFGGRIVDDMDFIKDYLRETQIETLKDSIERHKDLIDVRNERIELELNIFDENDIEDSDDSLFSNDDDESKNGEDSDSLKSIEEAFRPDNRPNPNNEPNGKMEEILPKPQNTEAELQAKEVAYYEKMIQRLDEENSVLVWFVGTSHYEM